MKRGLIALDPKVAPPSLYQSRVRNLQEVLAESDLDAALVYGSVFRSDDITYLTNLTIYWNEAVLVVPRLGEPILLTKLSARTQPWMRSISTLEDVRNGKDLYDLIVAVSNELELRAVAIVDEDWWPDQLFRGMEQLFGSRMAPAPGLVSGVRIVPDATERRLLFKAAELASNAIREAAPKRPVNADVQSSLEQYARMRGVTDLLARVRSADGCTAIHVAVQYLGIWAEEAAIFGEDRSSTKWIDRTRRAFDATVNSAAAGIPGNQLVKPAEEQFRSTANGRTALTWQLRCQTHADIGNGGQLRVNRKDDMRSGGVYAISLEVLGPNGGCVSLARMVEAHPKSVRVIADASATVR